MANIDENDPAQYKITAQGKEIARQLLKGVPPSELGEDLAGAAIILYAYRRLLQGEVKQLEGTVRRFKNKLKTRREELKRTENLMQTYRDA